MRLLKFLCFNLLLSFFTQTKGSNLLDVSGYKFEFKSTSTHDKKNIVVLKSTDTHKILLLKRKSKTKGLKVGVPNISALSIVARYNYSRSISLIILEIYTSFQVSDNHKRGPPSI